MVRHVFFILISCCFLAACGDKNSTDTITVGTNSQFYPYEFVDKTGKLVGFDIDVAKALGKKLEKKVVIKDLSFDALILSLKQHKIDCILAGMSITPSREKEIVMIPYQGKTLTSFTLCFWKELPEKDPTLSTLRGKTINVQVGTIQQDFISTIPDITMKTLEDPSEMILDLQHRKASAVVLEPAIAFEMQKKFPELIVLEFPLEEKFHSKGNGIGVDKKNLVLISEIEAAVNALHEDGTIAALEKEWFGK